jgi:pyruvate formate lyase activating enzyme
MQVRSESGVVETRGVIFNIMRFAVNDGPGIRTTVFLKGCPLSCLWCHNPESQSFSPEPMYGPEKCIACRECVQACQHGAMRWHDSKPVTDVEHCQLCGACCDACPSEARRLVGYRVSVPDLVARILRDRIILEESNGGVTFSGGEPLAQADFLCAALEACRAEGLHTAVDTCGYARADVFERVSRLTDLFLFDLKLMDPIRHKDATGVENGPILRNLCAATGSGRELIVRIPVVPGINDDRDNVVSMLEFLASAGVKKVDLLPYHATGMEKYWRLHATRPKELAPPSDAQMNTLLDQFACRGFAVRIGG